MPASVFTSLCCKLLRDHAVLVELDVGLRNGVFVFFPRRQIEAEGNRVDGPLAFLLQLCVQLVRLILLDVVAHAQAAFARVHNLHEIQNLRVLHLAVRRLDESVLVDARKAAQ